MALARSRPVAHPSTGANDSSPVKSAERTVKILETLAASPTKLTLSELQERMGYPRSSLHALVRTLRELKWVEADESGSAFGVGPHALLSGTAADWLRQRNESPGFRRTGRYLSGSVYLALGAATAISGSGKD